MMNRRLFMQVTTGVLSSITQAKSLSAGNHQSVDIKHHLLKGDVESILNYRYDLDGIFYENNRIDVELDRAQLIVIAGRPCMGKSILIQNIAQHVSMSKKASIGYFSEIKISPLINRMIGAQQVFSESDAEHALNEIMQFNIVIDDRSQLTMNELSKSITKMVNEQHIRLLLIDSIDNIYIKKASSDEKVAEVMQYLKKLSQILKIPIIISVGLNDDIYQREDKHPKLTDLVNYRIVEELADSITYLYRDEIYEENSNYIGQIIIRPISANGRVYSGMPFKFDGKNFCLRDYESIQHI